MNPVIRRSQQTVCAHTFSRRLKRDLARWGVKAVVLLVGIVFCLFCRTANGQNGCPNLIVNGDFESGFSDFTTNLTPSCDPIGCATGAFCVVSEFRDKCSLWPDDFWDHTLGNSNGGFLAIDGHTSSPTDVWSTANPLSVTPGVTYEFSFWVASVHNSTNQQFDLGIIINNAPPILVNISQNIPAWTNYTVQWTCPSGVFNVPISIRQMTPGAFRDFGIDDISFACVCCTDYPDFLVTAQNVQTFGTLGNCYITAEAQGLTECMQITYYWGDGSSTGPITSNNVLVSHTYSGSNTYFPCYTIEELSNGTPCWEYTHCDTILVICDSCCTDFDLFCQNVMGAVVVTADDDLCKVTFNIGDLPECDYIEYIDWGDNSAQEYGPFVSGDMPMHVYANSGTYVLSYLAIERDPISELICFEKFLTETITLQCDTCACQSDLTLQIGSSIYPVSCFPHIGPVPISPCPSSDVTLSGLFGCVDPDTGLPCGNETVSWLLTGPNTLMAGTSTYFPLLTFPASQVSIAGSYTLYLAANCNNGDTCYCEITWVQETCEYCACPGNMDLAINHVTNGNFEMGDVGFTTQLLPNNPCSSGYTVGTDFPDQCNLWPAGVFDHTTGSGNFLIVDGDPINAPTIWSQPVNVVPGKTYCFSFWTASVYCLNQQEFTLTVDIVGIENGSSVSKPIGGDNINEPCVPGQPFAPTWQHHFFNWTCPAGFGPPYTLEINQYSGLFGPGFTDFGLDDICFTETCGCPEGSFSGTELVDNGTFGSGNTLFSSDYGALTQPPGCSPRLYTVTDALNVGSFCTNWACNDHTTGLPLDLFFVADGSQTPGDAAWRQGPYTIDALATYSLCAWVNNLYVPSYNADDPIIEVYLTDNSVDHLIATTPPIPEAPDAWVNISATWTSPYSSPQQLYLEFRTASTAHDGNNFALDDISFMECSKTSIDSCCTDYDLFCQNVMNAVSLTVDNSLCKAILQIGNLPPCDSISWINWGQGPIQQGQFGAGDMAMHTYAGSGTYFISYLAVEYDMSTSPPTLCFEKLLHDTIVINCFMLSDTCNASCDPTNRSWNTISNNHFINDMVVYQGKLIVGGSFSVAGANNIAAWDGTNWTILGSGFNGDVNALTVYNGVLIAGGGFTLADGNPAVGIAQWTGLTWAPVGGGVTGGVLSLQVIGPDLFAGGIFSSAGGNPANNIARWNGSAWSALGAGTNAAVWGLGVYNGNLVAGGVFSQPGNSIAIWNSISSTWSSLGGGINPIAGNQFQGAKAILQLNNDLIVGGRFMEASNISGTVSGTQHIARWDGTNWNSMATGVNTSFEGIYDLIIYDGELYAGGLYTQIGGNPFSGVTKWDGTGWVTTNHADRLVRALEIYMAGTFCELYSGGEVFLNVWDCLISTHDFVLENIQVYPNPTSGELIVDLSALNNQRNALRIVDLAGKQISEIRIKNESHLQSIDASALPEGMYFIQILSGEQVTAVGKFVKQ